MSREETGNVRVMRLWPGDAPGARGRDEDDIPTLSVSLPRDEKRCGSAALIFPGGGYARLALGHEGEEVAAWLASLGVAACVLRYRCAPKYPFPIPLLDARRAVRLVRGHARGWGVEPDRIGVIGFSAGGHLASVIGIRFDAGNPEASDAIDRLSSRLDFMVLGYPLISMIEGCTHLESRENLLGRHPEPHRVCELSSEHQVGPDTPPTFLFHPTADEAVPVRNSILFHEACLSADIPVELHLYEGGSHGLGLASNDPVLNTWPDLCARWMSRHGWIPETQRRRRRVSSAPKV